MIVRYYLVKTLVQDGVVQPTVDPVDTTVSEQQEENDREGNVTPTVHKRSHQGSQGSKGSNTGSNGGVSGGLSSSQRGSGGISSGGGGVVTGVGRHHGSKGLLDRGSWGVEGRSGLGSFSCGQDAISQVNVPVQTTEAADLAQEPGHGHDGNTGQGLHRHLNLELDLVLEVFGVLLVGLVKHEEVGQCREGKVHEEGAHVGEGQEREDLTNKVILGQVGEGLARGHGRGEDIGNDGRDGLEGRGGGGSELGLEFRP